MTAPTGLSQVESFSYSVRTCARCTTVMNRTQARFRRTVWECPSCGKRAR